MGKKKKKKKKKKRYQYLISVIDIANILNKFIFLE